MTIIASLAPSVNAPALRPAAADRLRYICYALDVLRRYYEQAKASAEISCLHSAASCADGSCLVCEADRVSAELSAEGV